MPLSPGTPAPDFELEDHHGSPFRLSREMASRACVVYFYPKDFTPVCTAEACGFRDEFGQFERLGIPVLGISKDSPEIHAHFRERFQIPFVLLSDPGNAIAKVYGLKPGLFSSLSRVTFLLDNQHHIRRVFNSRFQGKAHAHEMLRALK